MLPGHAAQRFPALSLRCGWAKILAPVLQSGHFPPIRREAAGGSGGVASATFLSEMSQGAKP
jgi:hypothetical protein